MENKTEWEFAREWWNMLSEIGKAYFMEKYENSALFKEATDIEILNIFKKSVLQKQPETDVNDTEEVKERESGYYKLKIKVVPNEISNTVGLYYSDKKYWVVMGSPHIFKDDDFESIDEKISFEASESDLIVKLKEAKDAIKEFEIYFDNASKITGIVNEEFDLWKLANNTLSTLESLKYI